MCLSYEVSANVPILPLMDLRCGEGNKFVKDHESSKWWKWEEDQVFLPASDFGRVTSKANRKQVTHT